MSPSNELSSLSQTSLDLREPWLVAAWPGMGGVAPIAISYLIQQLGAKAVAEVPLQSYFDVEAIVVEHGVLKHADLPRGHLYGWKNPGPGRDLLLFHADRQPPARGYRFCQELTAAAKELGASRVVTFAALGMPISPEAEPKVHGVATESGLLDALREVGVGPLAEGRIGGLNGVLLAAAAEAGVDGICLLGELPFFASAVPNPKASAAILRAFCGLARIEIDMDPIKKSAEDVERKLMQHLRSQGEAASMIVAAEESFGDETDPVVEAEIEALFEESRRDRSHALRLKSLLDRHGLFKKYEDRFLDLFKQAD